MPPDAAIAYGAADAVMPYGTAETPVLRRESGPAPASGRPAPDEVATPEVRLAIPAPLLVAAAAPPPAQPPPPPAPVTPAAVEGSPVSFRQLTAKLRKSPPPPAPDPAPPPAVAPMAPEPPKVPPAAAAPARPASAVGRAAVAERPPPPAAIAARRAVAPPAAPPPAAPPPAAPPPAARPPAPLAPPEPYKPPVLVILAPHPSYRQPDPPPLFVLVSPPPVPAWRAVAAAAARPKPEPDMAAAPAGEESPEDLAEHVAVPAPAPDVEPAPEQGWEEQPDPDVATPPEHEAVPDPDATVDALPAPEREPAAEPEPEPVDEPEQEPEPEAQPRPETAPEPEGDADLPPPPATEAGGLADPGPGPAVWLAAEAAPPPGLSVAAVEARPEPEADSSLRPSPGEMAAALLDIVWGALDLAPQERALAGDALLLLMPALAIRDLVMLAERVSVMDQPPPLLLSRLARHAHTEVAGVVLERAAKLGDEDLIAAAAFADPDRLRLIARRRSVSPLVSDHLVSAGDLLTVLALLRNSGAEISPSSFLRLAALAAEHASLRAPLAMRPDLPVAVALSLFWTLPPELRRVVLSRFLLDTVRLGRILALTGRGEGQPSALAVDTAVNSLLLGGSAAASGRFAELTGVSRETVLRILNDPHGEPMVALFKALGLGRTRFEDAFEKLRSGQGVLRSRRAPEELKALFDSLSFNKARVLLLYWDWHMRQVGPYAPAAGLVEAAALA